jgi:arabinofuranosyltransferase
LDHQNLSKFSLKLGLKKTMAQIQLCKWSFDKYRIIVLGGFILALFCFSIQVIYFYKGVYSLYDDAFITFRYSRNLAGGLGPVYNPGDPVEGYTTFLWMLILALGHWIGFDILSLSQILGFFSALIVLFLTYRLGILIGLDGWISIVPILLLSLNASFARYSVSGMETIFFISWIFAAYVLLMSNPISNGNIIFTSLLLVLATMTRPEGGLFLIILFVFHMLYLFRYLKANPRNRAEINKMKILFLWLFPWLFFYFPYLLWKAWFYGDLLPNTFYAKVGIINSEIITRGLIYVVLMLFVLNLYIFLLNLFLPAMRWTSIKKLITITVIIYLCYMIYIGGDHFMIFGPRFLIPIFPMLLLLGVAALNDLRLRLSKGKGNLIFINTLLLVFLIGIFVNQHERIAYVNNMNIDTRGWIRAGEWLADHAKNDEIIAVDAAGIIPFKTNLVTIDMYGLNDRYIAKLPSPDEGRGVAGHEKYAPNYVLDQQPDYVLSWIDLDGEPTTAGLPSVLDRFNNDYIILAVFLMREPKDDELVVIETSQFTPNLFDKGYMYAVYSRKSQIQ